MFGVLLTCLLIAVLACPLVASAASENILRFRPSAPDGGTVARTTESEEARMLGKWLRTTPQPGETEGQQPPPPTHALEPTDDDLASVLALVVVSDHDIRMIVERTGMLYDVATAAMNELGRRNVVTDAGGDFFKATQLSCPGPCGRGGHELRGQEIVITPPRFEWTCAACHDGRWTPPTEDAATPER